jgi:hypothetical protein
MTVTAHTHWFLGGEFLRIGEVKKRVSPPFFPSWPPFSNSHMMRKDGRLSCLGTYAGCVSA